uniref:Uncharacterized protein n=1 Tax=Anguilla anguilla TaxID=7936 RepID=A0A0E9P6T3_ANGAN
MGTAVTVYSCNLASSVIHQHLFQSGELNLIQYVCYLATCS